MNSNFTEYSPSHSVAAIFFQSENLKAVEGKANHLMGLKNRAVSVKCLATCVPGSQRLCALRQMQRKHCGAALPWAPAGGASCELLLIKHFWQLWSKLLGESFQSRINNEVTSSAPQYSAGPPTEGQVHFQIFFRHQSFKECSQWKLLCLGH